MIINNITLKNFKSHENTFIEFQSGISTIIGSNGVGKSSILEAVSFALFKHHTGKRVEQLIKKDEKEMEVILEFTAHGRTYKVSREKTKNTSKALLEIKEGDNFHPLTEKDRQVSSEIAKILDMDGELFLNAVYVRQGEIADLIGKTSSEKKR